LNFKELQDYLEKQMKMQHIYQPVMIRTLLKSKNVATVETIAKAFLQDDKSQIDYYKQITKNMPGKILRKNKVVTYQDGKFILDSPDFTDEQRKTLIKICNDKIRKYEEKYGEKIWIHRARASRIVPGSMRYTVLKNAKDRCELCGISKDEKFLEVDHITPVNKGGKIVLENLQALCYTCNAQKQDRDDTDFRKLHSLYETRDKQCIFCKSENSAKIVNSLAFVINDRFPITDGHVLICPRRHTESFFELGSSEQKACLNLLDGMKTKILENDKMVTGFNVGINIGEDAGQTIFHCHIHLIPRRNGDISNPEGGIRNIIPNKGKWK
jgi:diadenosine tetraphosphate (Ap4A) HIT family hydrolase/5-methylcytosine-specific restriction endonuclease McrA